MIRIELGKSIDAASLWLLERSITLFSDATVMSRSFTLARFRTRLSVKVSKYSTSSTTTLPTNLAIACASAPTSYYSIQTFQNQIPRLSFIHSEFCLTFKYLFRTAQSNRACDVEMDSVFVYLCTGKSKESGPCDVNAHIAGGSASVRSCCMRTCLYNMQFSAPGVVIPSDWRAKLILQ